jgi:hypothetical protein
MAMERFFHGNFTLYVIRQQSHECSVFRPGNIPIGQQSPFCK